MTKKCNPGVGAVPVNVIMIVVQLGPTYQTCIYFAEKLLRCYDHNLNTDRKTATLNLIRFVFSGIL